MPAIAAKNVFCRRLREARLAAGLSQKTLGIAAGIDPGVASARVNRYETGTHEPGIGTTTHLARALGVPLAYLYAEDDRLAKLIERFAAMTRRKQEELLKSLA